MNDNAYNLIETLALSPYSNTPIYWNVTDTVSTPEPGGLALLAMGLCGTAVLRRYRFGKSRPA